MSKSVLIVWASGHSDLSGNKLDDHHHQAKLGAAETQPDNALKPATQRAPIHHSCHLPPTQHARLKEVYTSLPDEQIRTSFAQTERTDLAHFHSGRHPALRRWQHLVGISKDAVCRLCGEEV